MAAWRCSAMPPRWLGLTSAWVSPRPARTRKSSRIRSRAIRICSKALLVSNASAYRSPERPWPRGAAWENTCSIMRRPKAGPTMRIGASSTAFRAFSSTPRHQLFFVQPRGSVHHMRSQDLPVRELARNMRLIGHCDQGGRPDGVQLMVHRGFAYIGHMFLKGFSVVNVKDPARPKVVQYVPAAQNTWNIHLQTHDDLLLVINAKDMFAAPEFQDEKAYYKGELGRKAGTADIGGRARASRGRVSG